MLDFLKSLFTNFALLTPIAAWLVAQILKAVIASLMDHKIRVERLFGDGGLPSCHSSMVTSLAVMCGYVSGVGSPVFAVSVMVALIVTHDALGVRRETGKQAVTIQQLVQAFNAQFTERDEQIRSEKLKVLVGHTPLQVIMGAVVGAAVSIAAIFIFGIPYGG